jgi:ribonuclease D
MSQFPFVSDAAGLDALLRILEPHRVIAVDTEGDSLHSYYEKLCLLQLSVPGCDAIVDPLAGFSLEPLLRLLKTRRVVIHGMDFDLRMLRRAGPFEPPDVFDTVIAARLAGYREFGLAALARAEFGIELAKGPQKSNWARRPLDERLLDYARNDTRHLIPLATSLERKLAGLGRIDWFLESCERARASSLVVKERDPDAIWRIAGSGALRGRPAAILRALWRWRDFEAQRVDRPTFHILQNSEMIALSHAIDSGQWEIPPRLHGSRRRRFEEAVHAALELPQAEWPKFERRARPAPIPDFDARFESFRRVRDAAARRVDLDPSLIAPRSALECLAARRNPGLMRWQNALLEIPDDFPGVADGAEG